MTVASAVPTSAVRIASAMLSVPVLAKSLPLPRIPRPRSR